jgi:RNA recognition motif-containing protein
MAGLIQNDRGPKRSMNNLVSLYICDIPQEIEKEEIEKLFKDFGGFKDIRVARDKTK